VDFVTYGGSSFKGEVLKTSITGVSRYTRNDRFPLIVILRSKATKNLVPGKEHISVRRTRCFAPLSMTLRKKGLPALDSPFIVMVKKL
jgi:hypothetical protein